MNRMLAEVFMPAAPVSPFGDEVLAMIEPWWTAGPCITPLRPDAV